MKYSRLVGFIDLFYDFSLAGIYTCCWMRIPWLDHVTAENVFDAQSIHQYITYIYMHCWPGIGHFQSDFSDQFHFKAQIARSQQFMPIRASCLAVVQVLDCKFISCDGEFASKRASDCQCRHPTYIGTACADPSNKINLIIKI